MKKSDLLPAVNKLKEVSRKNLGKAFTSLFVLAMLMSGISALFGGTALLLFQKKAEGFLFTAGVYALLFAGIFVWFLLLDGFLVMLYRMVKNEYVTFGYLFYGFMRFKRTAGAALICTFLTALASFVIVCAVKLFSLYRAELLEKLADSFSAQTLYLVLAVITVLVMLLFLYPQIFLIFVIISNPGICVFKASLVSMKLVFSDFFKPVIFILRSGGRNLILAVFYAGIAFTLPQNETSFALKLLGMVFGFLYFINIYKAVTLMFMAVPVLYEHVTAPEVHITVSMDE